MEPGLVIQPFEMGAARVRGMGFGNWTEARKKWSETGWRRMEETGREVGSQTGNPMGRIEKRMGMRALTQ